MKDVYAGKVFVEPRRQLQLSVVLSVALAIQAERSPPSVRTKRPEKKADLEPRQAALFAYGRSLLGKDESLRFAMIAEQDDSADVVIRTQTKAGSFVYERIQLKEVVPIEVNDRQTIVSLLAAIKKRYCCGEELSIAIHLNREVITRLGSIPDPALRGVSFWLFGLCRENRGFLVQNPFLDFEVFEFDLPRMPSSLTGL